jgi:histidinol-phosphate phosphatase family protein
VLFDRDGTLVEDVPYNGDPARVRPAPGAREALDRLRAAGFAIGVVTNQSAVGRGMLTEADVDAVHRRVEELLGPIDTWQVCPHDPYAGCRCRKPEPGLVFAAAAQLGIPTTHLFVVGDIGADMAAAAAAGAAGILVPTDLTRHGEVVGAPAVAHSLSEAVDQILLRAGLPVRPEVPAAAPGAHVLAVRPDSLGDVLLTEPALRAIAARAEKVTLLCGPRGRAAAQLLDSPTDLLEYPVPWIDSSAPEPRPGDFARIVEALASRAFDEAVIFTSFHQSPLPFALLLREAGVARISAISVDFPGPLLDVRHRVPDRLPEAERALSLAAAAGYPLPAGISPVPRVAVAPRQRDPGLVVVHPGASVPARTASVALYSDVVNLLAGNGFEVLVTGAPDERELTARVAAAGGRDLGGRTSLRELAEVFAGCGAVVVGNTGPAHLAVATGTPVVSLFAPTVPYGQWGPHGVPHVRLGAGAAPCTDTRATACPVQGHPCLDAIDPAEVLAAVRTLAGAGGRP